MIRTRAVPSVLLVAASITAIACGNDPTAPAPLKLSMVPAGVLGAPRELHTATLLGDGKVLIAGGVNLTDFPLTAELFDPVSGAFTAVARMGAVHLSGTATLLENGKVLVAGGKSAAGIPVATAELFDPVTGTFVMIGSMMTARVYFPATLLPNGRVFMVGGLPSGPTATAELYDPTSGTFFMAGRM